MNFVRVDLERNEGPCKSKKGDVYIILNFGSISQPYTVLSREYTCHGTVFFQVCGLLVS